MSGVWPYDVRRIARVYVPNYICYDMFVCFSLALTKLIYIVCVVPTDEPTPYAPQMFQLGVRPTILIMVGEHVNFSENHKRDFRFTTPGSTNVIMPAKKILENYLWI